MNPQQEMELNRIRGICIPSLDICIIPSLDSLNEKIRTYHLDYRVMCPNVSPIRGLIKSEHQDLLIQRFINGDKIE